MANIINDNLLAEFEDRNDEYSAIGFLVKLGQSKGFITDNDILRAFPKGQKDIGHLEQAFTTLINLGIPYIEDDRSKEPDEHERATEEESDEANEGVISQEDNPLAHIDSSDLIGLYFKDAASSPLLTVEEELELAKRIERGCMAREELILAKTSPKRSKELHRSIEDEWVALEHLIRSNTRLVISVAKKHVGRGVPFIDLIQEGNIGLMRAAKKFDYKRGYKFSTYATWWIRQAVTRAIADQGRTIHVPVYISDQIYKTFKTQRQLEQRLGRDPTTEELAEALEVPPTRVLYLFQAARHSLSLEMPTTVEGDSVLGDFIEDKEAPVPDEVATRNLLRQHLDKVLETLPPREVRILQLRYGLADGKKHTLQEVGNKMGVSRERIRQIEAQALRRLRRPSIRRKLRAYLRRW